MRMNCSCKLWPSSIESLHVHPRLCNCFLCFFMPSWENFNSNKRKGSTRSLLVAGGVKGSRGIDGHSPQNRPSRFRSEGQEEEGEYVYITVSSTLTKGDGWQPLFTLGLSKMSFGSNISWGENFYLSVYLTVYLRLSSPSISLSLAARDRIETRNQELDTHHHHHHHHHHYHHHHTPIEGAWSHASSGNTASLAKVRASSTWWPLKLRTTPNCFHHEG